MTKVVFVGDSPSNKNSVAGVAFVGASCHARLVDWICQLEPDYYVVLNSDTEVDLYKARELAKVGFKVVALGAKASMRLKNNLVEHHAMPHPSGLNRKNNNKASLIEELNKAYNYIHCK